MPESWVFAMADRAYWRLRGRRLSATLTPDILIGLICSRVIQAVRGQVVGARYLRRPALHFRAHAVRVRCPSRFDVGSAVVLGDNVLIDARCDNGVRLGDRVTVDRGASILGCGVVGEGGVGVIVEAGAAVGAYNVIWGQGGVRIGPDCLLGPHVVIVSSSHEIGDRDRPINRQGDQRAPIVIGADVWIGAGAVVTAGVRIGRSAIVGAGAVVTRDIPPGEIWAGVPARRVGVR